jgi:hypothetical protein
MLNKGLISSLLALIIIIVVGVMFTMRGPDIARYRYLRDPGIRTMPPQRVLVVEAKGSPEIAGKKAFGLLFKAYFSLKGVPKKGKTVPAPRARWPRSVSVPIAEWSGLYAMALPDTIKGIPLPAAPKNLTIQVATWEYGKVAEILYTGPYDKEEPSITRLHGFVKDRGYEITGEHEEEYLRGPGMFFRGDPEKYVTIIRYRIKKTEPQGNR